jgi:DNA-binding NarL/FixJ family response regulator
MEHFQKTVAKNGDRITRVDKTKKILLIGSTKSAALLNRQETYRVFQCDTVRQAWNLVYRHRPHLIVLDLAKSALGGLSALQECRALAGPVPIVVVVPSHLTRPLAEALEHRVITVTSASSIARSVGKALQSVAGSLGSSGRGL